MAWFRRKPRAEDVDAEIQFHLKEEARLREDRGETAENAHLNARRAFGNIALTREDTRAVWTWTALEQLTQDVRSGCRILTTAPGLSAAAVLLIALVIGGNTTVFSIANGFISKPAQGVTAGRLVTLGWTDARGWVNPCTTPLAYQTFQEHSRTLERIVGSTGGRHTLSHRAGSYAVRAGAVSSNYFEALGIGIIKGRGFFRDEAAAVISYRTWENNFQRADDIIGTSVSLSGRPFTIVGVTTQGFRGATIPESADLWVPLDRSAEYVCVLGRLAPGISRQQAQAELSGLWVRLQKAHAEFDRNSRLVVGRYSANAGTGNLIDHRSSQFLAIFSVVTLITLVVVCANVANLLVARAVVRQRELALRQSLGASRVRIVRALMAEGLALSIVSWAAACTTAWMLTRTMSGYLAPNSQGATIPMPDFTPDWSVLGYALVLAMVCTVVCTLGPAMKAWRQPLLPPLKAGEQAVIAGRSRVSRVLVVVQMAFAVLLVACAGLAFRSLFLIGSFDSGFDTRGLLLVTVNTSGSTGDAEANAALLETFRTRLTAVNGVQHVSYARRPPSENWGGDRVRIPGSQDAIVAEMNHVGPDYTDTIGVSLLAGRDPTRDTVSRGVAAAMISQSLADEMWQGQSPIGRRLVVMNRGRESEVEVAGVVPDKYYSGFRRESRPFVFLSARHNPAPPGESTLYIRYSGGLDTVGPEVGRALQQVDSRAAIAFMRTWDTQIDAGVFPIRVLTILLTLFAGGSLFIAVIGQYAVVSFDMRRRVRELGLRMALGASARQVLTTVIREGFALTVVGLLIGFALSLAAGRVLGQALYGITPTDPVTYATVFALLSAVSLVACYLPARRAARIQPMNALRVE
ncbi:MAG: FtsX-like permease family protein [Acidobacteria bacterium]|nr:MAG: FtsX-like permease family protein [Acidobacteriota bacterium]